MRKVEHKQIENPDTQCCRIANPTEHSKERGVEEKGQLFANRIYDAVVELLNSMKEINYPAV